LPAGATGPEGPAGPKGEQGTPGIQGARGPSNGFHAAGGGFVDVLPAMTTVESLDLPAGSFVITAAGQLNNNDDTARTGSCVIDVGGAVTVGSGDVFLEAQTPGSQDFDWLTLTTGVTNATPQTASFRCQVLGVAPLEANVVSPQMTAIQVETLTEQ